MTEHLGTSSEHHGRVKEVSQSVASGLEQALNVVLEEEQANGAEVVDITFTSTSPFKGSTLTTGWGEYVAVIPLRSGHARLSSQ
jgi:hypothetical protein